MLGPLYPGTCRRGCFGDACQRIGDMPGRDSGWTREAKLCAVASIQTCHSCIVCICVLVYI